jgi:hypothetical protein
MNNEHELVEGLCQTYGTFIEKAFVRAVTHFYNLHKDELLTIRSATKATLINDYIYRYIQEELEYTGPFAFIDKPKGRFIGYDNKILIRIKKLSATKKPSVNKTFAANQFNTQTNMELLEGVRASNVYLGYVLSKTSGNIDKIAFAYPNTNGAITWTINIEEQRAQQTLDLDFVPYSRKTNRLTPKIPKRKTNQG